MPLDCERVYQAFKSLDIQEASATLPKIMECRSTKSCESYLDGKWRALDRKELEHLKASHWRTNLTSDWSTLEGQDRARVLNKIASVLDGQAAALAKAEVSETAVSVERMVSEVLPSLAKYVRYYAGWAGSPPQDLAVLKPKGSILVDVRQAPFPLLAAVWSMAPALASGNTCSILASGRRCASLLSVLRACSGIPDGSLNIIIVPEDEFSAPAICDGSGVIFAPFQSAKSAGVSTFVEHGMSLFSLHGQSSMLVLRHADVEAAAQACLSEVVMKKDLSCWPLTEVLVEEHLYASFTSRLESLLASLATASMPTPTAAEKQWFESMKQYSEGNHLKILSKSESCVLILLGGRAPEPSNSWEADKTRRPVAVLPVRSSSEALGIVGSRPRVQSASVWTEDGTLAMQTAVTLKMGTVWINQHGVMPHPAARFGSWTSGGGMQFGGKYGLFNFLQCGTCGESKCTPTSAVSVNAGCSKQQAAEPVLSMFYAGESRRDGQTSELLGTNNKVIARTTLATGKDVDSAVSAALKAQPGWQAKGAAGRAAGLHSLSEALKAQENSYVALLSAADGEKGAQAARADVAAATKAIFKWICLADKMQGEMIGDGRPGSQLVTKLPLGVLSLCGDSAATQSLAGLMELLAAALVLGNTVVLGASPSNPLPVLLTAQALLLHAPLPAGVLGVLSWGVEPHLANHPDVAALWMGREGASISSATFKRVWRLPPCCSPSQCPQHWLVYQATQQKMIAL